MHSYFETLGKYLLFTKYLTSTNCLLPQEQTTKTKMLSVVRIQQKEYLVLSRVTSRLLLTKYLASTNMPTAQQKKGTQLKIYILVVPHCPDKSGSTVCHN